MKKKNIIRKVLWGILAEALIVLTAASKTNAATKEATFKSANISQSIQTTLFFADKSYKARTPQTVCFNDGKGHVNIASYSAGTLNIYRYGKTFGKLDSKISIRNPLSEFGYIIADKDSHYYVLWGQSDSNAKNIVVTRLGKYDYSGKLLSKCDIKGFDSNPFFDDGDYWGTKIPFDAGSCRMAINGTVLACNYAREMYSGHQSNFVFYVDINSMKRVKGDENSPYCSHSFDQAVIPIDNGEFLFANHGDAYDRGFVLEKSGGTPYGNSGEFASFHFREGANRDHGYNETYAQLGGLAQTANAYVLCGCSERTLSLACAPTNTTYCGHSAARDLFVQILKKDFENYSGGDKYLVKGQTRKATGKRTYDALTTLYLSGTEVDYGVVWLTKLSSDMFVNNPKIVAIGGGNFALLWEELKYSNHTGKAYYMVMDDNGNTIIKKTALPDNVKIMGNSDLAYIDRSIYWVTSSWTGTGILHKLSFSIEPKKNIEIAGNEYEATLDDMGKVKCLKLIKYNGNAANLTIDTAVVDGKTVKITAIGDSAVKGNKYLANLTIGKSVETIGKSSFAKCSKLATVKGGAKVTSIGTSAFYNCKALKSFAEMGQIKTIEDKAFSGDAKLKKFTISKNVAKIGSSAFSGCSALKNITIKTKKLTSDKVGKNAFKNINAKAVVKVPSSKLSAYKKLLKSKGINKKKQKIKK